MSAVRGRFHHHALPQPPSAALQHCDLTDELTGSVHPVSYAKVPVAAVFCSISAFLQATLALQECEASWLALHRAGVLDCQSSYTTTTAPRAGTSTGAGETDADTSGGASTSTSSAVRTRVLTVARVLHLLGIHDATSLHRYCAQAMAAPIRTCHDLVCLLAADHHQQAASAASAASSSGLARSLSLQPVRLWQAWVHSVGQLLEGGGGGGGEHLRVVWQEMGALHLLLLLPEEDLDRDLVRGGGSGDGVFQGASVVSAWLGEQHPAEDQDEVQGQEDEEERFLRGGQGDEEGWYQAADSVLREVHLCTTHLCTTHL